MFKVKSNFTTRKLRMKSKTDLKQLFIRLVERQSIKFVNDACDPWNMEELTIWILQKPFPHQHQSLPTSWFLLLSYKSNTDYLHSLENPFFLMSQSRLFLSGDFLSSHKVAYNTFCCGNTYNYYINVYDSKFPHIRFTIKGRHNKFIRRGLVSIKVSAN